MIFYTTGEVLRPLTKDSPPARGGGDTPPSAKPPQPNLVPYALSDILSQRGWEEYHLLLVLYWQPYLDGRVSFDDAIAHLVSAV